MPTPSIFIPPRKKFQKDERMIVHLNPDRHGLLVSRINILYLKYTLRSSIH